MHGERDAIAQRADVARMTVYYQFKSKGKLLEALFDDFGARANMRDMRKAFMQPDSASALRTLIGIFCRLWQSEHLLMRRLGAIAALDPEVATAVAERNSWRREALTNIVERAAKEPRARDIVDLLHVLTSFETYDALAATERSPKQIEALLQGAALAILS